MNKLTAIRIKYDDGTYSDEIPVSTLAEYIFWDDSHNLVDILGNIDMSKGTVQAQLNEKIDDNELDQYLSDEISTDVGDWLDTHISPSGNTTIVYDTSLKTPHAAAESKATGDTLKTIVKISNTQPLSEFNRIWIKNNETEVEIPTKEELDDVTEQIGDLTELETTEKSNLVGAINEVLGDVPQVDNTLSVTGAAADAKKTGDKLTELNERLSDVEEDVADITSDIERMSETEETHEYIPLEKPAPYIASVTKRDITFEQRSNGTIYVHGTNTSGVRARHAIQIDSNGTTMKFSLQEGKTYRFTGCPASGGDEKYGLEFQNGSVTIGDYGSGEIRTVHTSGEYEAIISVWSGITIDEVFTVNVEEVITVTEVTTAKDTVAREAIETIQTTIENITENVEDTDYIPLEIPALYVWSRVDRGLTFDQRADGTIRVSGTNTSSGRVGSGFYTSRTEEITFSLQAGKKYRFSGCPASGGDLKYCIELYGPQTFGEYGTGRTITVSQTGTYKPVIRVWSGITLDEIFTINIEEVVVTEDVVTAKDIVAREAVNRMNNYASPRDFGAVGDGVTDDTAAFVSAENSDKSAIFVPKGVYNITNFMTQKPIIMDREAWLTTTSLNEEVVIGITGNNNVYSLNLDLTNAQPHYGVKVYGNHNHFEQVVINGLEHDGSLGLRVNSGLSVSGSSNTFDFVKLLNFIHVNGSESSNPSAPQGITFHGTATNNYFGDVYINNCQAGVVNDGDVNSINRFNVLCVTDCHDNAAYLVGGGTTEIGTLIHSGTDEGLCVITDNATADTPLNELSRATVGTFISTGTYYNTIRTRNTGEIKIGNMFVKATVRNILAVERQGDVHSGMVDIDNLVFEGSVRQPILLSTPRGGTLESLRLGRVFIKDNHIESELPLKTGVNNYIDLTMVKKVVIDDLRIELSDAESEYTNTDISVKMELKNDLESSCIGKVSFKKPSNSGDGTVLKIFPAKQTGLAVSHGLFIYNSSLNEVDYESSSKYQNGVYSFLAPLYGTWNQGDIVLSNRPQSISAGEVGFICVVGGTPGTWAGLKTYPYPGAVQYANGKFQYWNGNIGTGSWVDVPTT